MLRPGSFGGPQPKRGRSSEAGPVSLPVGDECGGVLEVGKRLDDHVA